MCVCVYAWSLSPCLTLSDTLDCIPPGSSVHGIFQARILAWVVIFYSRDLPNPGIKLVSELVQFSSLQLLSRVRLSATPWIAARQASLFITNSRSSFRLTSIEVVMPSSHLILCRPLLLLPSVFSSIRVFSNESALCIRWPKYWSFSFNISSSSEHPGLILVGSSCSPRDSQEFNSLELERRKC